MTEDAPDRDSDKKVDAVLALANSLNLSFYAALKLFNAGYTTAADVRSLPTETIARTIGVSEATARTILRWQGAAIVRARKEAAAATAPAAEVVELVEPAPIALQEEPVEFDERKGVEYGKLYKLDPNIKSVWWWSNAPALLFIFIMGGVPFAIFSPVLAIIGAFIMSFVGLGFISYWVGLTYDNYHFGFTGELVIVKEGILFKSETHIPFGRIQNINSHQGILDRMFDVWHLGVSVTGAYSMIHGVPFHETVREFIRRNVEAVKTRRLPKVDESQGYKEVYDALKDIARTLESYHSRAIISHTKAEG